MANIAPRLDSTVKEIKSTIIEIVMNENARGGRGRLLPRAQGAVIAYYSVRFNNAACRVIR